MEVLKVNLVRTIDYLNKGHIWLIERPTNENDKGILSILVNSTKFRYNEELDRYLRDLEIGKKTCEFAGVIAIFNPKVNKIYGEGFCAFIETEILTKKLCGKN
ncbi:hypothetical protein GNF80_10155 [Clostridium perfringens]|nr:hypothetical protein [Clostridium perfringens]